MDGRADAQRRAEQTLRHFLSAVEDIEDLNRWMPVGTYDATAEDEGERRWRIVLRAMLLRKFFLDADELFLPRVVNAVLAVFGSNLQSDQLAALRQMRREIVTFEDMVEFGTPNGPVTGEGAIHADALYGRYIHGDFDRWERSGFNSSFELIAVFFVSSDREARVVALATTVRRLLGSEAS